MATTTALHKLPPELCMLIMEQCDSPWQIKSFISADPRALSCYTRYRLQILGSARARLFEIIAVPYLIPLALLATKLRNLRQKSHLYDEEAYEQRFDILLARSKDKIAHQVPPSLGFLCALSDLISDADEMIYEYSFYWSTAAEGCAYNFWDHPLESASPPPSLREIRQRRAAVFHFEIFSCAYVRSETLLPDPRIIPPLLKDKVYHGHFSENIGALYWIIEIQHHVGEQHRQIFRRIVGSISSSMNNDNNNMATDPLEEEDEWDALMNDPDFPESPAGRRFFCAMQQQTDYDVGSRYISWLQHQGITLLKSLRKMKPQDQEKFTIANYFRVMQFIDA